MDSNVYFRAWLTDDKRSKVLSPLVDPLNLAKHPIWVLGIVSIAGFYIVAPTQLFNIKRRGRFFKARLCPCDLKHANMTFVCCFPSNTFFCQQLQKDKERRKENSAEKRARPIVPARGDQERKAFALMRPFLQWRHCLSCSASLSKLVLHNLQLYLIWLVHGIISFTFFLLKCMGVQGKVQFDSLCTVDESPTTSIKINFSM